MNIPEKDLRFAYYYILKHQYGYIAELDTIHKDIAEYFHNINYISTGVDALGRERYKTTQLGLEDARLSYIAMCSGLMV